MEVIPLSIPLESFLSALTLTILHPTTGTGFLHRCFISADCKRTTVLQNWGHVYAWISRLRVIFMSPCSLFFYFQNDVCNISCWKCYFNLSTFRIRKQLFFSSHTLEVTVKCRSLCYKVHGALLIICNYSMYFGPFPLFFFFFIYLSYIWRQETPQTITVGDNKTVLCRFSCVSSPFWSCKINVLRPYNNRSTQICGSQIASTIILWSLSICDHTHWYA
jgi:hypothetical protein